MNDMSFTCDDVCEEVLEKNSRVFARPLRGFFVCLSMVFHNFWKKGRGLTGLTCVY